MIEHANAHHALIGQVVGEAVVEITFHAREDFRVFGKVRKLFHASEHAIRSRCVVGHAGTVHQSIRVEIVTVAHIEHVGVVDALVLHHPIGESAADGGHACIVEEGHRARRSGDDVRFFKAGLHRVGHAGTRDDVMREIVPVLDEAASDDGGV